MDTEPKKTRTKGGRPRKYASDAKRPTMAFRIRGDMHEKLVASAASGGISVSEDIERRLIWSLGFAKDANNEMIFRMVRDAFEISEAVTGKRWFQDNSTAHICYNSVMQALAILFVNDQSMPIDKTVGEEIKEAGEGVGVEVLMRNLGITDETVYEKVREPVRSYITSQAFRNVLANALISTADAPALVADIVSEDAQ